MDGRTPTLDLHPTAAADASLANRSRDELEAQITELAGQMNAANYRYLLLIAEFDRRAKKCA